MKIIKITQQSFGGEQKIEVEVEGYPHAQPTFPVDISKADLEIALKEWIVKQDAVDLINAQAKQVIPPTPVVKAELTSLIGKEITTSKVAFSEPLAGMAIEGSGENIIQPEVIPSYNLPMVGISFIVIILLAIVIYKRK